MAETIESFVAKLQQEGLQAGRRAGDEIREQARQEADRVLADARMQAEKIVADARAEAEKIASRSRTELSLAARDTLLRLRQALSQVLTQILTADVSRKLADSQFLTSLLRELVLTYARADAAGAGRIRLKLPDDLRRQFQDSALKEIARAAQEKGLAVDVEGGLREAGFEYELAGGKVEVTAGSLMETLREMVSPALRDVVDRAAGAA